MRKVSVLMPIHNGEKYLPRALDSIYVQSYEDFEVVAVLNNCTDNSAEILKDFDATVVYCDTPGIVPALNTGIMYCEGELVARMDVDDFWYETKLEKQVEFLDNNPNISIVGTQIRRVDVNGNEIESQVRYPVEDSQIKQTLMNGSNCIAHPSVVFRKSIIERAGIYDDSFPLAEDYHYWLRCLRWYNFANLDEVLVDYTSNPNPNYNPNVPLIACRTMLFLYKNLGLIG